MERLAAPAVDTGTYEALSHLSDHAETEGDQSARTPFASADIPAEGGVVAVPLASGAKDVLELVGAEFRTAPPESVTPRQMLSSLLRSDSGFHSLCAQFGVHLENIERV